MIYKLIMNKKVILIILLLIFSLFVLKVKSSLTGWSEDIQITEDKKEISSESPSVASYDGVVCIVWQNNYYKDGRSEIFFRLKDENGEWGNITRLTYNKSQSLDPHVAIYQDNIHVIWVDDRDGNWEIYYKVSRDGGRTWSNDTRLTYDDANSVNPSILVNDENIYVLWKDYRNGPAEVYYKVSNDNGLTWSKDIRFTHDDTPSYFPAIGVEKNNICIAWQDIGKKHNIYCKVSKDGGKNWSEPTLLSHGSDDSEKPSVTISGNYIHIVWQDYRDGNWEIYYKVSRDGGRTWSNDTRLTYDDANSVNPSVLAYKNNLSLIWMDDRDGNWEIYYKVSRDGGRTWSNDTRLTYDDANSYAPSFSLERNTIYLVWERYDEKGSIYFKQKTNQSPIITSIDATKKNIFVGSYLVIRIYGYDIEDNTSSLSCKVEYKASSGNWRSLKTVFINDHWEAKLNIPQNGEIGYYDIRAKLIDKTGEESGWIQEKKAFLVKEIDTPDFEVTPIFIILFLLYLYLKLKN